MKLLNLNNLKTNQTSVIACAICEKCLSKEETFSNHTCDCEDKTRTPNTAVNASINASVNTSANKSVNTLVNKSANKINTVNNISYITTNSITNNSTNCSSSSLVSSSYPSQSTTYTDTYSNTNKSECYLLNNDKQNLSIANLDSRFSNEKTMNAKLKNHRLNPTTNRSNSSNNLYEPNSNKFTKRQKQCLASILAAEFSAFATMACISPFFPDRAAKMGLSTQQSGLTFSIYAIASVIFSPIMGKFIPIFGGKNIMLFGILCNGISNILFGFTEFVTDKDVFFYSCLVLRITEALGTISHVTAAYTYVIKVFPNDISYVFSLTESFVGAGLASGPALGGLIYSVSNYGVPFYFFGTVVLLCFPITWYFVDEIKDDENSLENSTTKENLSVSFEAGSTKSMTFGRVLIKLEVIINSLVLILSSASNSFFFPTLEEHLKTINIVNIEIVALMFFIGSSTYVISTLVLGKYLGEIKYQYSVMLIGICVTILSLLVIGPSELFFFLNAGLLNTSLGMVLMGLGTSAAFLPTFECYYRSCIKFGLEDNLQTYSAVAGVWSMFFSCGEAIGPSLGGALLTWFNFADSAEIVACILVLLIPALMVMVIKEFRWVNAEKKKNQARQNDPTSSITNLSNSSTVMASNNPK